MSYPTLPTFTAPFTFTSGVANAVEQDSIDDVASCVRNIVSCVQGFRDDLPDFGIPDPLFQAAPFNLQATQEAIGRWEPRAVLNVQQQFTPPSAEQIIETVTLRTDQDQG